LPLERAAKERADYWDNPKQYKEIWIETQQPSAPPPPPPPPPSKYDEVDEMELFGPVTPVAPKEKGQEKIQKLRSVFTDLEQTLKKTYETHVVHDFEYPVSIHFKEQDIPLETLLKELDKLTYVSCLFFTKLLTIDPRQEWHVRYAVFDREWKELKHPEFPPPSLLIQLAVLDQSIGYLG
jgi:hypothetical protein